MENPSITFSAELKTAIESVAVQRHFSAGDVILDTGDYIRSLPVVRSGAVRVMRTDKDERELLLYYLEPGETCAATLSCCLAQQRSSIRAVAELDTDLLLIPLEHVDSWITKYPEWRTFVFKSYRERFDELLSAVDAVAFHNLEDRILAMLREKAGLRSRNADGIKPQNKQIEITHQQLADELHTSRVVVSRMLKALEHREVLTLHRNMIELTE
ncbi:MAG: Crp/Fnr family transcriptional regulator [Saprospiraceae bacterium]